MLGKQQFKRLGLYIAISSALTPVVHAQVLEEITVTAQRREQSIQEVPISLEAFSGATLAKEGFRAIEDLSNFSPSVEIDVRTQDQDVSIRGMGTTGNNLGLSRQNQIQTCIIAMICATRIEGQYFRRAVNM